MKTALLALLVVVLMMGCIAVVSDDSSGGSAKKDALAFDALLMDKMDAALDRVETLEDTVSSISDGSDLGALDTLASDIFDIQNSLDEIETETSAEVLYVGAVRAYVANARVVVESTAAYLETGNAEDFEKIEHYTGMYADLLDNVTEKRAAFLSGEGLAK